MAHRVAPISVSIALGHTSANAVKATAGAGPLVAPTVYLSHSTLICRVQDQKAVSTILKVFGMTRPGLKPTTYRLCGRRSTTGPSFRYHTENRGCKRF